MNTRTTVISILLGSALTLGVFAQTQDTIGRTTAADGEQSQLSGSSEYRDGEWYLDTDSGSYRIMMGRYGYTEELPLSDGAPTEIEGFVADDAVAPIRLTANGETMEFWSEDGIPLWAGAGARRGAVSQRGPGLAENQAADPQAADPQAAGMRNSKGRQGGALQQTAPQRGTRSQVRTPRR